MVTITENKLIIEFDDTDPKNLHSELKSAIFTILQSLDFNSNCDTNELETAHYFILKLLKELTA